MSREEDLEKNLLSVLESVPLEIMHWYIVNVTISVRLRVLMTGHLTTYARRSHKFIDAYYKGLDGKQAAWALKKYCGHCVLPESLMDDLLKANL